MNIIPSKHNYRVLGLMTVILLVLAACGGSGGTSSGSGGGGSASVARVSGTIAAANASAGLDVEQRVFESTGAFVAIGNFLISTAQAFGSVAGIPVIVTCNDGTVASGVTDGGGNFNIGINVTSPTNCIATFGPDPDNPTNPDLVVAFSINPTTQTEVKVSLLADGTLKLIGVSQEESDVETDNGTGSIKVTEDDDSSGNEKFPICHKPGTPAEKTLSLPASALPGHRGHGDTDGACT